MSALSDTSANDLKVQGNHFFSSKKFDSALECYDAALKCAESTDVKATLLLNGAAALFELGNFQRSIAQCQQVKIISPYHLKAYWRIGKCFVAMGKPAEAQAEWAAALGIQQPAEECLTEKQGKDMEEVKKAIAKLLETVHPQRNNSGARGQYQFRAQNPSSLQMSPAQMQQFMQMQQQQQNQDANAPVGPARGAWGAGKASGMTLAQRMKMNAAKASDAAVEEKEREKKKEQRANAASAGSPVDSAAEESALLDAHSVDFRHRYCPQVEESPRQLASSNATVMVMVLISHADASHILDQALLGDRSKVKAAEGENKNENEINDGDGDGDAALKQTKTPGVCRTNETGLRGEEEGGADAGAVTAIPPENAFLLLTAAAAPGGQRQTLGETLTLSASSYEGGLPVLSELKEEGKGEVPSDKTGPCGYKLTWYPPCGEVKKGESLAAAARRIVAYECGPSVADRLVVAGIVAIEDYPSLVRPPYYRFSVAATLNAAPPPASSSFSSSPSFPDPSSTNGKHFAAWAPCRAVAHDSFIAFGSGDFFPLVQQWNARASIAQPPRTPRLLDDYSQGLGVGMGPVAEAEAEKEAEAEVERRCVTLSMPAGVEEVAGRGGATVPPSATAALFTRQLVETVLLTEPKPVPEGAYADSANDAKDDQEGPDARDEAKQVPVSRLGEGEGEGQGEGEGEREREGASVAAEAEDSAPSPVSTWLEGPSYVLLVKQFFDRRTKRLVRTDKSSAGGSFVAEDCDFFWTLPSAALLKGETAMFAGSKLARGALGFTAKMEGCISVAGAIREGLGTNGAGSEVKVEEGAMEETGSAGITLHGIRFTVLASSQFYAPSPSSSSSAPSSSVTVSVVPRWGEVDPEFKPEESGIFGQHRWFTKDDLDAVAASETIRPDLPALLSPFLRRRAQGPPRTQHSAAALICTDTF